MFTFLTTLSSALAASIVGFLNEMVQRVCRHLGKRNLAKARKCYIKYLYWFVLSIFFLQIIVSAAIYFYSFTNSSQKIGREMRAVLFQWSICSYFNILTYYILVMGSALELRNILSIQSVVGGIFGKFALAYLLCIYLDMELNGLYMAKNIDLGIRNLIGIILILTKDIEGYEGINNN